MKILTIIGARPQFIKAAALSRAIRNRYAGKVQEIILHTGQHYDENMSKVFFHELNIPEPDFVFSLKGKLPEEQLAEMESEIGNILSLVKPDAVVVYGDTNSTYAGAIAAHKNNVPLVHIEAGLRSWNNEMPEERNRVYADGVSTLLFTPTKAGYNNLINEGFPENNLPPYSSNNPKIYHCGDVMLDNSLYFSSIAEETTNILSRQRLVPGEFILATIHRNTNTDHEARLNAIVEVFIKISEIHHIILPIHPRTKKMMEQLLSDNNRQKLAAASGLKICEPVSFLEMIALEKNCRMVMTDSGGVQKEAFYFKKPCLVLRGETEWVELVQCGAAMLAGSSDSGKIFDAFLRLTQHSPTVYPDYYGDGKAAEFICEALIKNFS